MTFIVYGNFYYNVLHQFDRTINFTNIVVLVKNQRFFENTWTPLYSGVSAELDLGQWVQRVRLKTLKAARWRGKRLSVVAAGKSWEVAAAFSIRFRESAKA